MSGGIIMKRMAVLIIIISSLSILYSQELVFQPREPLPFFLNSPGGRFSLNETPGKWPASLRIETEGDGSNTQVVAKSITPFDITNKNIVLWLRLDKISHMKDLWIYLSSDNEFANRIVYMISKDKTQLIEGPWLKITIPSSGGAAWGSPVLDKITNLQLWVNDHGSGGVTLDMGPVYLEEAAQGAVVLTFDDGWESTVTKAAPIMAEFGMAGTAYIIPNLLGTPGYMTQEQALGLKEKFGWSLGAHYWERLDSKSPEEVKRIFQETAGWFIQRDIPRPNFSYPNGAFTRELLVAVADFFSSARTIVEFPETMPPGDLYRIRSLNIVPDLPKEKIRDRLEAATAGGGLVVMIFHKITQNSEYETELEEEDFKDICRMISESGLEVLTMSEVVQRSENRIEPVFPQNSPTLLQPLVNDDAPQEKTVENRPVQPYTAGADPAAPLLTPAAGKPVLTAGTQIDISLDWKFVLGRRIAGDDFQYYNQLEDLHLYLQTTLSDSAMLFAAAGIQDVNFTDFTTGAIGGEDFYLKSLYLTQALGDRISLTAGYLSPDPKFKWLQVTRSAGIEPAFGQDITPDSLWLAAAAEILPEFGFQLAFNPDLIGTESGDTRVLTYQQALGVPNIFGSLWYSSDLLTAEVAAALNGDAVKLAAAASGKQDFEKVSLLESLGVKYITAGNFTTFPDWDHQENLRLSGGFTLLLPIESFNFSSGLAYQITIPPEGTPGHRGGLDLGLTWKNLELFGAVTAYDLTSPEWQTNTGFEAGLKLDYDGVEYMIGYTMAGYNVISGLYNNKEGNEGGVNGLFIRIKATYW